MTPVSLVAAPAMAIAMVLLAATPVAASDAVELDANAHVGTSDAAGGARVLVTVDGLGWVGAGAYLSYDGETLCHNADAGFEALGTGEIVFMGNC